MRTWTLKRQQKDVSVTLLTIDKIIRVSLQLYKGNRSTQSIPFFY